MKDFSAAKDVPTKKYTDTLVGVVVCNRSSSVQQEQQCAIVVVSVGQRRNKTEIHRHTSVSGSYASGRCPYAASTKGHIWDKSIIKDIHRTQPHKLPGSYTSGRCRYVASSGRRDSLSPCSLCCQQSRNSLLGVFDPLRKEHPSGGSFLAPGTAPPHRGPRERRCYGFLFVFTCYYSVIFHGTAPPHRDPRERGCYSVCVCVCVRVWCVCVCLLTLTLGTEPPNSGPRELRCYAHCM